MERPTPSLANFSAIWAASTTPPMQVSAMTHSTGRPLAWRRFSVSRSATALASAIVGPSRDSRTPFSRPSMVGRMPILGMLLINLFWGGFIFRPSTLVIVMSSSFFCNPILEIWHGCALGAQSARLYTKSRGLVKLSEHSPGMLGRMTAYITPCEVAVLFRGPEPGIWASHLAEDHRATTEGRP